MRPRGKVPDRELTYRCLYGGSLSLSYLKEEAFNSGQMYFGDIFAAILLKCFSFVVPEDRFYKKFETRGNGCNANSEALQATLGLHLVPVHSKVLVRGLRSDFAAVLSHRTGKIISLRVFVESLHRDVVMLEQERSFHKLLPPYLKCTIV